MALAPTNMRAFSITSNICAMPLWTPPTSEPTAGSFAPKVSSQVVETFSPIFFSSPVTTTPLRAPSSPVSRSTWCLGTRNSDSPFVPGPPAPSTPTGRASTRWKMFSGQSHSAEVMKRLTPRMCQEPSGWRWAVARAAPTSEPASGSVSTIVPPHWRSIASSAKRFCSGVPLRCRMAAKPAPEPNM